MATHYAAVNNPLIRPRWESAALLTIDVQNDFTNDDAPARIVGTKEVLLPIGQLLAAFRTRRLPIYQVVRLYARDGSDAEISRRVFVRTRGPIVAPGTLGAELVDILKPDKYVRLDASALLAGERQQIGPLEWVMYKARWGAFYRTQLESWLRELGVDTVVVCGCNFPNCPRATITEASERDFRTAIVSDATSRTDERGLAEIAAIGASIFSTAELISALEVSEPK